MRRPTCPQLRRIRRWLRRILGPPTSLGARGERVAERFLRQSGLWIVARGSRDRFGEIDLIAIEGRVIVFVEVKTRRSHQRGHPADAVDLEKQRRIARLALAYLSRHDLLECRVRFDIVAVTWPEDRRRPVVEHFRAAFEPPDDAGLF